jgi:hypothetical protein
MDPTTGERVVVRFWRWNSEQLARDARLDQIVKRDAGVAHAGYSVSVWARPVFEGETSETAIDELIDLVSKHRSARWAAVVTERELSDAGFKIELSEPPPCHDDLPIEDPGDTVLLQKLEDVFGLRERRKVPRV